MTKPVCYPLIRTLDDGHVRVEVTYAEGAAPVVGCGETWCMGVCGLPAIVIPARVVGGELKMRSSMVAVGHVMQAMPVAWTGARVDVLEEHWDDFMRRMWW